MARKKNKAITINRNRYNDIKRMDHGSMEEYVNEVYEKTLRPGRKRQQDPLIQHWPWRQSARSRALAQ